MLAHTRGAAALALDFPAPYPLGDCEHLAALDCCTAAAGGAEPESLAVQGGNAGNVKVTLSCYRQGPDIIDKSAGVTPVTGARAHKRLRASLIRARETVTPVTPQYISNYIKGIRSNKQGNGAVTQRMRRYRPAPRGFIPVTREALRHVG